MLRKLASTAVLLMLLTSPVTADEPTVDGKPLSHWLTLLKDADAGNRLEAVLALEEMGAKPKGVVDALAGATTDKDARVRETAIKVLGGFGDSACSAVPALLKALEDKEGDVRVAAVLALRRIDLGAKGVHEALGGLVPHEHKETANAAAEALAQTGKRGTELLLKHRKHPQPLVRERVLGALAKVEPRSEEVTRAMIESLKDGEPSVRRQAALSLVATIDPVEDTVPALLPLLEDKEKPVRIAAGYALGSALRFGAGRLEATLQVRIGKRFAERVLSEPDPLVKAVLVCALRDAEPFLLRPVFNAFKPEEQVKFAYVVATTPVGESYYDNPQEVQRVLPFLVKLLEDDSWLNRLGGFGELYRAKLVDEAAATAYVNAAVREKLPAVRQTAFTLLQELGEKARPALPALRDHAKTPDDAVRKLVADTLRKIEAGPSR